MIEGKGFEEFLKTLETASNTNEKVIRDLTGDRYKDNITNTVFKLQLEILKSFQEIAKMNIRCDLQKYVKKLGNLDEIFPNNCKDEKGIVPIHFAQYFSNENYLDVLSSIADGALFDENKTFLQLIIQIYKNHQSQDSVNFVSSEIKRIFKFDALLHYFNGPSCIPKIPEGIPLF